MTQLQHNAQEMVMGFVSELSDHETVEALEAIIDEAERIMALAEQRIEESIEEEEEG